MKLKVTLVSFLLIGTELSAAESSSSLWTMIKQGGWAMYPLAAASLALIYLFVHCWRETRDKEFGDDSLAKKVKQLCSEKSLDQVVENLDANTSALGRVLSNALPKFDEGNPIESKDSFENEVADSLELEENAIAQWIHYLSVIANVAPMIGLLGTVSGMIGGFQTMSSGGMGRPELFAGDIGEALITTATGLCIGIPAMIAHSYFNNRLNTLVVETGRRANMVSDSLLERAKTLV